MKIGIIAALAALTLAGCEQREDDAQAEITLDEAQEQGLLIEGFQDVEGIQRTLDTYFSQLQARTDPLRDAAFDAFEADAAAAAAELAEIQGFGDLAMEAIEFLPDLEQAPSDAADGFWSGLGDTSSEVPGGAFAAGFPGSDGLAAQGGPRSEPIRDGSGRIIGQRTITVTSEGTVVESTYSNGEQTGWYRLQSGDGNLVREGRYHIGQDGRMIRAEETVTDPRTGQGKRVVQDGDNEPIGDGTSGGDDGDSEGDSPEETPAGDLDKFQPADGMEGGTFCPLTLDICRREMAKALDSGEDVVAGIILVNPAEPDVMPEAPRLAFDTETLVINPDPTVTDTNQVREPRAFRMQLPVWVLPPRPNT